jgi:competence ComEA-like helix-hairpin-helix protein
LNHLFIFYSIRKLKANAIAFNLLFSKLSDNYISESMKSMISIIIFSSLFLSFWLPAQAADFSRCIDINAATKEELMKIIHIGNSRAEQIISLRQETPFASVDDLERVAGIGPALLLEIKKQDLVCVTKELPQSMSEPEAKTRSESVRIDINTASLDELQQLDGIGPMLAQRIIGARPFYSVDELTKVSRIGLKTLEDIKKQGLAWVDPELEPPEIIKQKSLQNDSIFVEKPPQDVEKASLPGSFPAFLVACGLAGFSGGAILVLKKKLKIS